MSLHADKDCLLFEEICSQLLSESINLRLPTLNEKVHKDDCVYCFCDPFFDGEKIIFFF